MRAIGIVTALFFLAGCGHGKVDVKEAQTSSNGVVNMSLNWLKDKGKKYDIEIKVQNVAADKDIIFMLNDMQCYKGNLQGMLKHTFFNTGERTIDFRKGQMKQFRMVCDLGATVEGDYRIVIKRIFDNPKADGKTTGEVIAENVEMKLPQKK